MHQANLAHCMATLLSLNIHWLLWCTSDSVLYKPYTLPHFLSGIFIHLYFPGLAALYPNQCLISFWGLPSDLGTFTHSASMPSITLTSGNTHATANVLLPQSQLSRKWRTEGTSHPKIKKLRQHVQCPCKMPHALTIVITVHNDQCWEGYFGK